MHGIDYFWCTGNNWSGGTKHNGMYADHKSCDHNCWRSCMVKCHKNGNKNNGQLNETSLNLQKLLLGSLLSMTNVVMHFCTQAGLSAEAIDQI